MDQQIAQKLSEAKAKLIIRQPFFATILFSMPVIVEPNLPCPTMGTDGKNLYVHPGFVMEHTREQLMFALCHEALHVAFGHMFRRKGRDPAKWNIAADYIINDLLEREKVGDLVQGIYLDADIVRRGNGTAEGVYDILPDQPQGKGSGSGGAGQPWDNCMDAQGSQAERSQAEAEARVLVSQAAAAAKLKGKMSGALQQFVDAMLAPRVDWKERLRAFVTERAKVDFTWARPKRRFLAQGLYLPSLGGQTMGDVVLAVDYSGSVSDAEKQIYAAEMRGIQADANPARVHVMYFDSSISKIESFEQGEPVQLRDGRSGGTAFSPIFARIAEEGWDPSCCVVLTDLRCNDFGPQPDYPVMWVATERGTAPWGEIVFMHDHGVQAAA